MKRFVYKSAFFTLPFLILYILSAIFTSQKKGDLLRISSLFDNTYNYRKKFEKEFSDSVKFTYLSDLNRMVKNKFTVLTIGDSFSRQNRIGYQNYLQDKYIDVLYYDKSVYPIETLYALLKNDFFQCIHVDFVVLQCVERNIIADTQNINYFLSLNCNTIFQKDVINPPPKKDNQNIYFFSPRVIKFPLNNLLYFFTDKPFSSDVYKVKTQKNLFSVKSQDVLFFSQDISGVKKANNIDNVIKANNILSDLSEKLSAINVKLIVLISPDKYDIYYDYFYDKTKFIEPLFFEHMKKLNKEYYFVESRDILSKAINKTKDIYFYDDTHWSPIGSKIIGNELKKIINSQNTKKK